MAAQAQVDLESQLIDDLGGFTHNPAGFAAYAYEWEENELVQSHGPRAWQADILNHIGAHLASPETRYTPCRIAVASGHGIGKTALISIVLSWALSTCEDSRAVVTANTKNQLDTKTVPEVSKWFRRAINAHWFDVAATSIRAKDPKSAKTWRADFIPWSEQNPDAFAGLHNQGKRIVVIFDEASGIAPVIWETTEGALTDEDTEIIWLAFGNPLRNDGKFFECFGSQKHRWKTYQIDARTVEGTNKAQMQGWVDDYGEDSDFVKTRVRGEFPNAASNQFIPTNIVEAARRNEISGYEHLPKILSVDVARFGDDQTVIGMRQGRKFKILGKYRQLSTVFTTERIIEFVNQYHPEAVVVDEDGVGGPVIDQLRARNYGKGLHGFHGGAEALDRKYFNRRAEVWGLTRDWLNGGADIPDDAELASDLTGPLYDYASGKRNYGSIALEEKKDMKERGLSSPDCGDCLAMTFGVNVKAAPKREAQPYVRSAMQSSWS